VSSSLPLYRFLVQRAEYGAAGNPSEKTDVCEFVQQQLDAGTREIVVMDMAKINDPAPSIRKKLQIEYAYDWSPESAYTLEAFDGESILMNQDAVSIDVKSAKYGILDDETRSFDVTDKLQAILYRGENHLVVRVTNLWPNKMIGDDFLPEDTERFEDGRPKAWPQWLLDGQPSPTGRELFTAWKLWNKDLLLLPSGMTGPVRIVTTKQFQLFP